MNKLLWTLALGSILAAGAVSVNAWASEGSNDGSEHVGGTSSVSSSTQVAKASESGNDANETEGSNGESENESDDGPVALPALKPIGTNVLDPLLLKKKQSSGASTLY